MQFLDFIPVKAAEQNLIVDDHIAHNRPVERNHWRPGPPVKNPEAQAHQGCPNSNEIQIRAQVVDPDQVQRSQKAAENWIASITGRGYCIEDYIDSHTPDSLSVSCKK